MEQKEMTITEYIIAQLEQRKSGLSEPNMYVYGGGKEIEKWCQAHGLRYLDEYMNIKKKQINNYGKQD